MPRQHARAQRMGGVGLFAASSGSTRSRRHSLRRARRVGTSDRRQRGVALVVVMTVVAILAVFLTEMLQTNATAFHVAVSQRDKVKAEYLAKSGLNLTRLLIAREPDIRKVVAPMFKMVLGTNPPQLNVWAFADQLLAPFISPSHAQEMGAGIDFGQMEGLIETGGELEVLAIPENSKINVSNALFLSGDKAKTSLALQLFTLMGGNQLQSPYDAMFEREDADGQLSTRLDIIAAIIDWWDIDQLRTQYDPGQGGVVSAGREDDIYSRFRDPYQVKNAPFDSLEELRMVRGIGDDFWANFVEQDPLDPRTRRLTIYGSGAVNVNESPPDVVWSRLCSYVPEQPLCQQPDQLRAFQFMLGTAQSIARVSAFATPKDFLDFMQGRGKIYELIAGFVGGPDSPFLAWTPVVIPGDRMKEIERAFITEAAIFTIQSTVRVGRAEVRLSSVVNFHRKWTPPPPNPGQMPVLGIFHHYRVD